MNSKTPHPENPVLFDKFFLEIQKHLVAKLDWLDIAYGKSQKLVTNYTDKPNFQYPGIHIKKGEYESLLPGKDKGNFSFFFVEDPQEYSYEPNTSGDLEAKVGLIFWIDLDSIFGKTKDRHLENVKDQIITTLTKNMVLKSGSIRINKILEQFENIYKGFSLKEVDSQYIMQPYAGFKFECYVKIKEGLC